MTTYRTNMSFTLLLVTVAICAAGCASGRRPSNARAGAGDSRSRRMHDVITRPEIERTRALTAYELVVRMRPDFLEAHTNRDVAGVAPEPVIYINGLLAGNVSVLRDIAAAMIVEVRYVPPRDAVFRHGPRSRGGEILLYTYRSRFADRAF